MGEAGAVRSAGRGGQWAAKLTRRILAGDWGLPAAAGGHVPLMHFHN